ncbi:hypothetical protein [Kriegella aquimaris]|uniref:Uncharacterized protein n=1 Tax=Kriegella aquimaris TaxID=192904 RepID=A0A1G9P2F5_9FLAO|nr:hypothetical protein [Kriegella aquimaris]SDL92839.1 hypothetical protein SAMN04488514_103415 [Kriegella aquimaris]
MARFVFFSFLVLLTSCNDGDLQIETLDFDTITTIGTCQTVDVSTANVLFKINDDEALILELSSGLLTNEIVTDDKVSLVTASGPSKVIYRIFSGTVTNNYFCDDIPLTEPTVIEEIIAEQGEILVTTATTDEKTYVHTLKLSNISFVTGNNTRITNLSINNFGTVSTTKTE